jgi:hypothetical protein
MNSSLNKYLSNYSDIPPSTKITSKLLNKQLVATEGGRRSDWELGAGPTVPSHTTVLRCNTSQKNGKLKGPYGSPRRRWNDSITMYWKKCGVGVYT